MKLYETFFFANALNSPIYKSLKQQITPFFSKIFISIAIIEFIICFRFIMLNIMFYNI